MKTRNAQSVLHMALFLYFSVSVNQIRYMFKSNHAASTAQNEKMRSDSKLISVQSVVVFIFHSLQYDPVPSGTKVKTTVDTGYRR